MIVPIEHTEQGNIALELGTLMEALKHATARGLAVEIDLVIRQTVVVRALLDHALHLVVRELHTVWREAVIRGVVDGCTR